MKYLLFKNIIVIYKYNNINKKYHGLPLTHAAWSSQLKLT